MPSAAKQLFNVTNDALCCAGLNTQYVGYFQLVVRPTFVISSSAPTAAARYTSNACGGEIREVAGVGGHAGRAMKMLDGNLHIDYRSTALAHITPSRFCVDGACPAPMATLTC